MLRIISFLTYFLFFLSHTVKAEDFQFFYEVQDSKHSLRDVVQMLYQRDIKTDEEFRDILLNLNPEMVKGDYHHHEGTLIRMPGYPKKPACGCKVLGSGKIIALRPIKKSQTGRAPASSVPATIVENKEDRRVAAVELLPLEKKIKPTNVKSKKNSVPKKSRKKIKRFSFALTPFYGAKLIEANDLASGGKSKVVSVNSFGIYGDFRAIIAGRFMAHASFGFNNYNFDGPAERPVQEDELREYHFKAGALYAVNSRARLGLYGGNSRRLFLLGSTRGDLVTLVDSNLPFIEGQGQYVLYSSNPSYLTLRALLAVHKSQQGGAIKVNQGAWGELALTYQRNFRKVGVTAELSYEQSEHETKVSHQSAKLVRLNLGVKVPF